MNSVCNWDCSKPELSSTSISWTIMADLLQQKKSGHIIGCIDVLSSDVWVCYCIWIAPFASFSETNTKQRPVKITNGHVFIICLIHPTKIHQNTIPNIPHHPKTFVCVFFHLCFFGKANFSPIKFDNFRFGGGSTRSFWDFPVRVFWHLWRSGPCVHMSWCSPWYFSWWWQLKFSPRNPRQNSKGSVFSDIICPL